MIYHTYIHVPILDIHLPGRSWKIRSVLTSEHSPLSEYPVCQKDMYLDLPGQSRKIPDHPSTHCMSVCKVTCPQTKWACTYRLLERLVLSPCASTALLLFLLQYLELSFDHPFLAVFESFPRDPYLQSLVVDLTVLLQSLLGTCSYLYLHSIVQKTWMCFSVRACVLCHTRVPVFVHAYFLGSAQTDRQTPNLRLSSLPWGLLRLAPIIRAQLYRLCGARSGSPQWSGVAMQS